MGESPRYRSDLYVGTAEFYDRYRPGYPNDMLADLVTRASLGEQARLLDLACGTGQIAFALAGRFGQVVAVDQEPGMVAYGSTKAAAQGVTNISWIVDRAEDVDVDGPFDLITIGSAFHRLERASVAERALSWLRPGRHLALVWDDTPWSGAAPWQRVMVEVRREWAQRLKVTDRVPADWEAEIDRDPHREVLLRAGFQKVEEHRCPRDRTWTLESLIGFVYSTSTHSRAALGERAADFELSFRERLLEIEPNGRFVDRSASAYEIATCP